MRFTIKHHRICPSRNCRPGISSRLPDLSPDQAPPEIPRSLAPLQDTEASRPPIHNTARIALLPRKTVRQGNKRLQATRLTRDLEKAFLNTHMFRQDHVRGKK
jgi:hypothetical protein